MANTYTRILIQAVFAVRYRQSLIDPSFENDLYKYMTGILQSEGHKMLQINGMPDHIHLLFGFRTHQSLADLMKVVKAKSSKWVNRNKFCTRNFAWQNGFGAFSYSPDALPYVARYIANQKQHHLKKTFQKEYKKILEEYEVEYDPEYVFLPME